MQDSIGQYLEDISHDVLSREEEQKLARKAQNGDDEARKELIENNLRLVVSIAKKHQGKGMEMQDMIQEGNLGLMKAIDKFDPEKGCRFSTYATWWIRSSITRALPEAKTIRVPVNVWEKTTKIFKTKDKLYNRLNREPTFREIAAEINIKPEKVQEIIRVAADQNLASLNQLIGENKDAELGEFVIDENVEDPFANIDHELMKEGLNKALGMLPDRQAEIIRLRFGLRDGRERTLKEVGKVIGVTGERIRQIQELAFRKLRHRTRISKLEIHMTG